MSKIKRNLNLTIELKSPAKDAKSNTVQITPSIAETLNTIERQFKTSSKNLNQTTQARMFDTPNRTLDNTPNLTPIS